jgi:hypothetical protein
LAGGAEENHKTPLSEYLVSLLTFAMTSFLTHYLQSSKFSARFYENSMQKRTPVLRESNSTESYTVMNSPHKIVSVVKLGVRR